MDQKCVLVTGGSRGIGAAVALQAAAKGHPVAVNYGSDEAAADRLVREIVDAGGNARAFRADIGSERAIEELFASVESAFGPPGALVNSAGIASHVRAADATGDAIRRLLDVNVTGTMLTCREAVPRSASVPVTSAR